MSPTKVQPPPGSGNEASSAPGGDATLTVLPSLVRAVQLCLSSHPDASEAVLIEWLRAKKWSASLATAGHVAEALRMARVTREGAVSGGAPALSIPRKAAPAPVATAHASNCDCADCTNKLRSSPTPMGTFYEAYDYPG